jgi:chorismate dehydratase
MRIGAVSYLNTKPLVYGLAEALAPRHELVFDLPSRLADRLAAGELDVALIPSIEFFQNPDYTIISDACIGCRGPVRSVKLLSRVPLEEIRTLALDEGSRTSVALVRILLKERFGLSPKLVSFPIDAPPESIQADDLLMIGDRAMHPAAGAFVAEWDLGDVWCRWSELPFVFAMWVARQGAGVRDQGPREQFVELADTLSQARDQGVSHVAQIAREEHARYGLSYEDCLTYLRDHLHFTLGPREIMALQVFNGHAHELGLAPSRAAFQQVHKHRRPSGSWAAIPNLRK